MAEPRLNAWLGTMFGNPRRVQWTVVVSTGVTHAADLSLLSLAPMDVVAMNGREFDSAIAVHARRVGGAGATVRRTLPDGASADAISLDEFAALADAARQVVGKATALTPANLALPEDEPLAPVDIAELRGRADAAVSALREAASQLAAAIGDGDPASPALERALATAQQFGLQTETAEGTPITPDAVSHELTVRLAKLDAVEATDPVEREQARLSAVFAGTFTVLPRFTPTNGADLQRTWNASAALQGGDADAAHTWLSRHSMVREGTGRLADVARIRRALDLTAADDPLVVGQLPFRAPDRWVALPFVPGQSLVGRRLSLVAWGAVPAMNAPVSGLLIDEWTERVPAPTETTGLAFHYDEPESRAPQSILIAVAPDVSKPWDLETLEAVLLETLELSKLRMVDSDAMVELDQYLPAMYITTNTANEAVSTDL